MCDLDLSVIKWEETKWLLNMVYVQTKFSFAKMLFFAVFFPSSTYERLELHHYTLDKHSAECKHIPVTDK